MTVTDQSGSSLGKFSCLIVEDDGGFAAMAAKVVREQNGEPVIVGTLAAAQEAVTVLLTGESGVGKDLAARILHQPSFAGTPAPFIAVNCAAIPAEIFESELFGAERGAYTGAEKRRTGLVGAAAGGTLFLDE